MYFELESFDLQLYWIYEFGGTRSYLGCGGGRIPFRNTSFIELKRMSHPFQSLLHHNDVTISIWRVKVVCMQAN